MLLNLFNMPFFFFFLLLIPHWILKLHFQRGRDLYPLGTGMHRPLCTHATKFTGFFHSLWVLLYLLVKAKVQMFFLDADVPIEPQLLYSKP